MKKLVKLLALSVLLLAFTSSAFAGLWVEQHYDFEREGLLTTFAYFGLDKTGSWFGFIDLRTENNVVDYSSSYFEFMRDFNFGKIFGQKGVMERFNLHLELNGTANNGDDMIGIAGLKFSIINKFVSPKDMISLNASISAKITRKDANYGGAGNGWQGTIDWNIVKPVGDKFKFQFAGFFDIWQLKDGDLTWITQPQLKFYFTKCIALGTELELSNDKYWENSGDLKFRPTVFVSYDF